MADDKSVRVHLLPAVGQKLGLHVIMLFKLCLDSVVHTVVTSVPYFHQVDAVLLSVGPLVGLSICDMHMLDPREHHHVWFAGLPAERQNPSWQKPFLGDSLLRVSLIAFCVCEKDAISHVAPACSLSQQVNRFSMSCCDLRMSERVSAPSQPMALCIYGRGTELAQCRGPWGGVWVPFPGQGDYKPLPDLHHELLLLVQEAFDFPEVIAGSREKATIGGVDRVIEGGLGRRGSLH